jgi:hypothetical protein
MLRTGRETHGNHSRRRQVMILGRVFPGRREILVALALAMALTLLGAAAAIGAGNMHFNGGGVKIGSLIFFGTVAGYGNEAASVDVTANGFVTAVCTNKGGNQAEGRNFIFVSVSGSGTFPIDENGNADVLVEVEDPTLADIVPSPSPKQAGCPSGKWTVTNIVEGRVNWTDVRAVARDANDVAQDELNFVCTTFFDPITGKTVDIACVETSG